MSLVQRLLWREEALRFQLATAANATLRDADALLRHHREFSSLETVAADDLIALPGEQLSHLRRAKVLLQLAPGGQAMMTTATAGASAYLRATLVADALWQDENEGGNYCILTLAGHPLYCSPGMPAPPAEYWSGKAGGERNSGVFTWQVTGEEHLASFWRVPLHAILAHEGLIVVVSDARASVLTVLARFRQLFPAVAILAMALAAWFAVGQIRRQMGPLERLEQHTRQLAQGNFSAHIEVAGDDEFSRLAGAFNSMSDRLDHKFHLLKALGELDRAILSISDMDSVIRLLLLQLPASLPCDQAGVLRFDSEGNAGLWIVDLALNTLESVSTVKNASARWPRIEGDETCFALQLSPADAHGLQYFAERGATHALVFPARANQRLDSALVLAYRQPAPASDEIVQAGRSLADRLAAAALSISWENKLHRQAHFDALTDLPNRTLLRDRVEQAFLRAERESLAVAVMLVDLDKFKDVNDSLGHAAGDALLVACAQRLRNGARPTDTVARLGGDEFVVLIPDLPRGGVVSIVDRIASALSLDLARPVDVGSARISVPASIGIALYPENGSEIDELMKNADAAMYESKREHYGSYRFYSQRMNVEIKLRFEMLQDLRKALANQEFFLLYQPKIDAATGQVVGAEALVRWASPRLGLVSPGQFIHLIDEIGLESRLGEWVIETACAQMAAWTAQGLAPIPVSVNASPAQFRSNGIVEQVRSALARNALPAKRLELEILESSAIGESGSINAILSELRAMDVGIALDDFGTGYSSLVYLTQLPATVLKIDRGFITDLLTDRRQQAIVRQIIQLAKALDFKVVAEGVEEEDQVRILSAMGCDLFQGYFFSRPLAPADFVEFHNNTAARLAGPQA